MGERKEDGERQISDSEQGGELRGRSPWTPLPGQGLGAKRIFEKSRDCNSEDVAPFEDMSLRSLKNHQVWSILPCM